MSMSILQLGPDMRSQRIHRCRHPSLRVRLKPRLDHHSMEEAILFKRRFLDASQPLVIGLVSVHGPEA